MEKHFRAGHATDDNMAHAHIMLDIFVYKHTLKIWNISWFSPAFVAKTRPNVTLYVHFLFILGAIVHCEEKPSSLTRFHDDTQLHTQQSVEIRALERAAIVICTL